MDRFVLRSNAIPVYGFLSLIISRLSREDAPGGMKVLDCGAGGTVPPLALFAEHGFEGWGVDTDQSQLDAARRFCDERGIELDLRVGDMRRLPFEDESFDYVYEHYSMCHLGKRDTARAVSEMHRVLRQGGLAFLGVISTDTTPLSGLGAEKEPGEFWTDDEEPCCHSAFSNQEADALVSAWEVLSKQKQVRFNPNFVAGMTEDAWMELCDRSDDPAARDAWRAAYVDRANVYRYVQLYFYLRKP